MQIKRQNFKAAQTEHVYREQTDLLMREHI